MTDPTTDTARYRKKPIAVEARQVPPSSDGKSGLELAAWCGGSVSGTYAEPKIFVPTLDGDLVARVGDWIVKGTRGEFWPVKGDIFAETYEPADAVSAVVPPADQTARVRAVAEALQQHSMVHLNDPDLTNEYDCCAEAAIDALRRLAGETADNTSEAEPIDPDDPESPAVAALADHLAKSPAGVVMAAFRRIGFAMELELKPAAGDRLRCPHCGEDITDYDEDDHVFRTGDERPYCSSDCVIAAHRKGLPIPAEAAAEAWDVPDARPGTTDHTLTQRAERPRCPHCQLPHDLTPGSMAVRACESIRASLAEAERLHGEGDHTRCAVVDCDVVRERRAARAAVEARQDGAQT